MPDDNDDENSAYEVKQYLFYIKNYEIIKILLNE